jgi:D-alanyl-D-alanine carboxypeptidase
LQRLGIALLWALLSVSSLATSGYGPPKLVDREVAPTQRLSVGELHSLAQIEAAPDVSASAYLVYDLGAERVVLQKDVASQLAPASLTKLMTALLVLEQGDLDAEVTIESRDLIGDASMGLVAGETVTVEDLLWGLLVPSGNDAAMALARHIDGSMETFVARMNRRAQELDLQSTHFVNPSGLDAPGHVSSAGDLLELTKWLWEYPLFRAIAGTAQVTQAGRTLINTNTWLASNPAVTGIKTGTTDAAGECLVASVEREGETLMIVILGSRDRYRDAEELLATYDAARAQWRVADTALTILNRVYHDRQVRFVHPVGGVSEKPSGFLGDPLPTHFRDLEAEISSTMARGEQAGTLEWRVGDEVVGSQALVVR